MENRIILKIKYRYYFLMPETIELLGSAKEKVTKDKNGENVLLLKYNYSIAILLAMIINMIQEP